MVKIINVGCGWNKQQHAIQEGVKRWNFHDISVAGFQLKTTQKDRYAI